jgi:hypothetical protein
LLFGWEKLELADGKSRCAFPFSSRELAEFHLAEWTQTLTRWKGLTTPPAIPRGKNSKVEAAGFVLELFPRPIELYVPLETDAFLGFYSYFWRRDFWPSQPPGMETGWDFWPQHSDIGMKLFSLFDMICKECSGLHIGRVPIAMSDTVAVQPDHYYFAKSRKECLIKDDYFFGVPDLIAEVLSPASRAIDRGPRKELYRRAGVPHLWLLEPELETIEVYQLTGADFERTGKYGRGDSFLPACSPSVTVQVSNLFDTQWTRRPPKREASAIEPIPEWLVPAGQLLGLEYLFLLGHPERRSEIWNNRAPCFLPFGSIVEARSRFEHFLEEACRWEQTARPKTSVLDANVEQAEVGRFRLTRKGRIVHLDVAVDGRKFRQLLEVWADRKAWDWGED